MRYFIDRLIRAVDQAIFLRIDSSVSSPPVILNAIYHSFLQDLSNEKCCSDLTYRFQRYSHKLFDGQVVAMLSVFKEI
jgi:hypothetical protein